MNTSNTLHSLFLLVDLWCASRCRQLRVELQSVVGLLEATLLERPPQITRELPAVLQVLIPLLQSPLAAPCIQQVFLDIGVCLMPKHFHHLGTWPVLACSCIDRHSILTLCHFLPF